MFMKRYSSKYARGRSCLRYFLLAIFVMALPQLSLGERDDASSSLEGSAAFGQLGSIEFPASGSREAHPHFLRGVAALHSFWYEEAIDAFRRVTTIDPDFVMGYWGEAMAHNHPVWQEENVEAAQAALGKVSDTASVTVRERQYLQAVNTLFGEGDKLARDQAYALKWSKLTPNARGVCTPVSDGSKAPAIVADGLPRQGSGHRWTFAFAYAHNHGFSKGDADYAVQRYFVPCLPQVNPYYVHSLDRMKCGGGEQLCSC